MRNKKLRLHLDNLSVESFSPESADTLLRGTVRGADASEVATACEPSIDWTYCGSISCLAPNCGSGTASLPGQETCNVQCHTSGPPPIE